jgi:hypothetical protein
LDDALDPRNFETENDDTANVSTSTGTVTNVAETETEGETASENITFKH